MSIEAFVWAQEQTAPSPADKLLLITLGDLAGMWAELWSANVSCPPGTLKRLSKIAQVAPNEVHDALGRLEEAGLLVDRDGWTCLAGGAVAEGPIRG